MIPGSPTARAFGLIFCAAFLLHIPLLLQYRSDPFFETAVSDALSYQQWGQRIAENGMAAEPVFHQAPLYPWLVSTWASETGQLMPLVFQSLATSLAVALLVPLTVLAGASLRAGVLAASLAALHGPVFFHSLKVLPVSVALLLEVAALTAMLWAHRREEVWTGVVPGLLIGLAALARAELLLLLPIGLIGVWRPRPLKSVLLLAGCVVALSPATLHNLKQGDFVLIASSTGENLFIGNQRGAQGDYTPLEGASNIFAVREVAERRAEEDLGRELKPSEVSRYWTGRSFEEIGADPVGWLGVVARKWGRILSPGDPTDIYSFPLERKHYLSFLWLLFVPVWTLIALAAYGVYRHRCWHLLGVVGLHLLVMTAFFVNTRLRLPLLVILAVFAGIAVDRLWAERKTWVVGLLLVVGLAGAFVAGPTPRDTLRLASVLSAQDRLDDSLAILQPHLAGDDADPRLLDQAGWVTQKQRDWSRAKAYYTRALEGGLDAGREASTRTRFAQVLERLGETDAAMAQLDLACAAVHANAGTFFERAALRARRGDRAGALADLERAIALDPDWPAPRRAKEQLLGG